MEQTEDQRTSAGGLRRCGVLLRTAAPGCSPGGAGLAAWDFGAVSAGRRPGLYPECAHAGHRAAPVPQKPEGRKAPPPPGPGADPGRGDRCAGPGWPGDRPGHRRCSHVHHSGDSCRLPATGAPAHRPGGEPTGPVASTGGAADEAAGGDPMAGAFCQGSGDRQGNWGRDCLLRWVHRRCGQRCQHLCHQPDLLLLCPAAEGEAGPPGPPGDLRPAAPAAGRPDAGRPAAVRADLLQLPLRASAWRPAFWARCSSRP